ncbi:MAG TPA: pyrroloquinoline quinone-dependent dehydrogenase [Sphingomicrobium sp.]|nr:pyrroloquinoline quinone-dependent dehydrogenase [Sphingomicrobium sp.]
MSQLIRSANGNEGVACAWSPGKRRFGRKGQLVGTLAACAFLAGSALADEWSAYGRDQQGTRFSPLKEITAHNVGHLSKAWEFHTGDIQRGTAKGIRSGFESTPLLVDGRLYLTTPFNRIIALDPETGRQLWSFDPKIDRTQAYGDGFINRGVAVFRLPHSKDACALRLFEATLDARLIAVDGVTGRACGGFGTDGAVDLRAVGNYREGWYHMTSPPIVMDGVVVVGSAIDDNARAEMPAGVVRGYSAVTGKLLWKWDPLRVPKGVSPAHWRTGAGNAWSIISGDPKRHLIYVPTGSASPDYFGGLRAGDNKWANSVVALRPATGTLVWGFQLVHHDLWDYDTAAPPLITTITLHGRKVPALFAGNKTGMIYVLDPNTGRPLLPVVERAVPPSPVQGELASRTQPFSLAFPSLARQTLRPKDAWGPTATDREECRRLISSSTGSSLFAPPSLTGSLSVPGAFGGINWSGFAWDASHQHLIVAVSNLPFKVQLIPAALFKAGEHGNFRAALAAQEGTPYALARAPLVGPSGLPCSPPPWGEVVAVDPGTGKIAWHHPVGSMRDVFHQRIRGSEGSVILGGPIVTGGGLVFLGGTMDHRIHALSAATGTELWSADLPTSAHAQPITYESHGRQFVLIAAGGSAKIDEEQLGDSLIAFALHPHRQRSTAPPSLLRHR